jgi:Family of unknown function (DUF6188)
MTATDNGLLSDHGRWMFPMAGGEVTQVQIDYSFGLSIETYGDVKASMSIRINTCFEYETNGVAITVDPEQAADLAPLITLHKAIVDEGYAIKDGHLVIRFTDGRAVRVAPDEQYESWQVTGDLPQVERKFKLIGLPNGGVALF